LGRNTSRSRPAARKFWQAPLFGRGQNRSQRESRHFKSFRRYAPDADQVVRSSRSFKEDGGDFGNWNCCRNKRDGVRCRAQKRPRPGGSILPSVRLLALLCLFAGLFGVRQGSAQDDAAKLLLDVRKKVVETVNRLPKYLCTETVDRSNFRPEVVVLSRSCDDLASQRKGTSWRIRKDTSDRLRLDVAVSGDSEMFSWAGENRFEDRTLADLCRVALHPPAHLVLSSVPSSDQRRHVYL
jgi:hypothetical protein